MSKNHFLYGISLLAFALVTPVIAQEESLVASQASGGIEEILITATRRTTSLQSTPASIDVLTGDTLSDSGVTEMRDLVKLSPNLTQQGSFGRAFPSYFIRGIGTTNFNPNTNSKVGIYVDDVYLSSPAVHGAQLFDVERVEIARGPQGTLFGQNTTAGLIHTITRSPVIGGGPDAYISATAGKYGSFSSNGAVGFDLGGSAAVRLSATTEQGGGWQKNAYLNNKTVGDLDATSARVKLLWRPADNLDIMFNVHGSVDHSEMTGYKQVGLLDPVTFGPCAAPGLGSGCIDFFGYVDTTDPKVGRYNVPDLTSKVRSVGGSVNITWSLPQGTVTAISAYERNKTRISEDSDGSPNDVIHGAYSSDPKQFTQEIRFASPDDGVLQWIVGGYYFQENFSGGVHYATNAFGPGIWVPTVPELQGFGQVSSMRTRSAAAFGSVDVHITSQLKASVGLRYTDETKDVNYAAFVTQTGGVTPSVYVDPAKTRQLAILQTIDFNPSKNWQMTSWRASLDYSPTEDVMFYALVSRGFNSGNFNGGAFFDPGEASLVDPERVTDVEGGFKSEWFDNTLRVNADMFHYAFKNQQTFVLAAGETGFVQQLANAASSTVWGGELEVTWTPVSGLFLHGGASYTKSKFDQFVSAVAGDLSGKRLPSSPRVTVTGSAHYDLPLHNMAVISAEVDTHMTSLQYYSADNNPLVSQDAYWLVDGRLAYTTPNGHFTIAIWGKNLTDKKYVAAAYDVSAFGFNDLIFGAPRTFGATGSWHL